MKLIIFIISSIIISSCSKEVKKNDVFISSLQKYYSTNNRSELQAAYLELKPKINDKEALLNYDKQSVVSAFMILKKYDELKMLVNNQSNIDYNDKLILNLLDYILEKKSGNIKKEFIYNNIKLVQDTLVKSPKDSLLYIDYFTMRSILKNNKGINDEIDSMQYTNSNFTDSYYNDILRVAIDEFYDSEVTDDIFNKEEKKR